MYECDYCDVEFSDRDELDEHLDDYDHWAECETCDREFRSIQASHQHMDALSHWKPRIPCGTCDKVFFSQAAADQHMNALGHYRNYCKDCDRHFDNENNLRMHRNSKIHRGTNVLCPFCKTAFVTASGLVHHIESGACPQAPVLDRATIIRMVQQSDPHGIITNKAIEAPEQTAVQYQATSRAYNGTYWECYICHKFFNTSQALNQHLNSPVHRQKMYHCPNKRSCGKEFVTLAALFNHLESESCGLMRFERVQNIQQGFIDAVINRRVITNF
ncbi:zinc finger protein [Penicillium brasilianum]|uniref:Zinc finger protein n=1 Tax=Penicillium brasilianum TaxID=104259 RepID=A0A1S9S026_PENBI|nr:zinc finger protein [Penicillium brasilianum]